MPYTSLRSKAQQFLVMVPLAVALGLIAAGFSILFVLIFFLCHPSPPARIAFKDRHVLITGGSSGIGLEMAKLAALEGATVSIMARDSARLQEAKLSIFGATGKEVSILSADVKDFDSVRSIVQKIEALDILICSHGVALPKSLEDSSLDDINHTLDTNLRGTLHVIKAILPSLKNRKDPRPASIAIVSSQAGQAGLYGYTAYSASKFGLRGIAEALQQEIICHNIRVSLIYPPDTITPGFQKENEMKPEITKLLSASSSTMSAFDVAKRALDGIKQGRFSIPCNFDGLMLCIVSAGMSPQPSVAHAFAEVLLAGLMRFVGLCVSWKWYQVLNKWHKDQNKCK